MAERKNYRWMVNTTNAPPFDGDDRILDLYMDIIAPGTTTSAKIIPEYESIAKQLVTPDMPASAETEIVKYLKAGSILCEPVSAHGPALPKPKKIRRSNLPSPDGMEYWVTEGLYAERRIKDKYAHMDNAELRRLTTMDVKQMTYNQLRGTFRRLEPKL